MSDNDLGTRYRFVPSLRRGFAPTDEFSEGMPEASARPTMGIDITPEARKRSKDGGGWETDETDRQIDLHVYGPGDVQGIDDAQIARVEPEPETRTFPPNYFPFLEFDRPGLPWRFSPEAADQDGRTRPWLTLVTVEDSEGVSVSVGGNRPCPVLELGEGVDIARELPDLRESWAWAHAQLQEGVDPDDWTSWAREELTSVSNVTASRLLSPRNLQADTDYIACLVPTFEAGRLAGLGREPYPDRGGEKGNGSGSSSPTDSKSLTLAWDLESPPKPPFELPLYHYWRFRAGGEGTFESLVTNLTPVELGAEVGMKEVDIADPGPDSLVPDEDEPTTHPVAGALYSAPAKEALSEYGKQERLRKLLNKPETIPSGDVEDYPIVGPPLYGKWHVGLDGIPPEDIREEYYDPAWFRELNLELRHRVAASIGGEVVKEYQSQLMSAAWDVVGQVREANTMTKNTQSAATIADALERATLGIGDQLDQGTVLDPSAQPWATRAELDRIQRLGGLDIDDIVDSPLGGAGGGRNPDDGTTQPPAGGGTGGPVGGEGGFPIGGGTDGPIGGGTGFPIGGGEAVDPAGRISTGYLFAGMDQPLLGRSDGAVPDGGGAALAAGENGLQDAAFYVEYLRTFSEQPETSTQYQRLVRRDGPVARRANITGEYYDQTLARVRDRTISELGVMADGLYSEIDSETMDGLPATAGIDDTSGSPTDQSSIPLDGAGVTAPTEWRSRIGDFAPRTAAVSTVDDSSSALDERVPPGSAIDGAAEMPGRVSDATSTEVEDDSTAAGDETAVPDDGEPADSVTALLSSLREHATSTKGRIEVARTTLAEDDDSESPAQTVLAAYEAIEPVTYGLDPLDRELSKAIADESVATAPALDERRRRDAMQTLRDSHGAVLAILTAVHDVLATEDTIADGGAASEHRSTFDLPDDPSRQDLDDALAGAEDELARFREELNALRSLLSTPTQSVSLDLFVREESPIDPRQESTLVANTLEVNQRLETGGSIRYHRGLLGDRFSWVDGREFVQPEDLVTEVMAAPEFPTPMWRPLKDYDEEFLLPGVGDVPADSVGLVVQNREFIEAYMAGLSHEMGRELLWRNYPTDRKGTYFRRFWNKGRGPAWEVPGQGVDVDETPSKDIEEIHNWDQSELGANAPGAGDSGTENVVLLVRGELFRRYPDAVVYAARAKAVTGTNDDGEEIVAVEPMTPERFVLNANTDDEDLQFPTFRGRIDPDVTFLGFDLTVDDVHPDDQNIRDIVEHGAVPEDGDDLGWYFVFEERPGETRFGLEVPEDEHTTSRPVGVATKTEDVFVPTENGQPKPVDAEPVGWDDVSWAHLVEDANTLDSLSYVPVQESRPGKQDWTVPESATDPQTNATASDLKDAVGRAFDEGDTATWGTNSAHMARIAWRTPARVAFHAMELLPDDQ